MVGGSGGEGAILDLLVIDTRAVNTLGCEPDSLAELLFARPLKKQRPPVTHRRPPPLPPLPPPPPPSMQSVSSPSVCSRRGKEHRMRTSAGFRVFLRVGVLSLR